MAVMKKVVVIGSGVGGLSCGVALARSGMDVRILEQHSVPGGFIQSFKHRKWKFNVGTHYVSNMDLNNQNNKIFNNITGQNIIYNNMDDVYEKIIFEDGSSYNVLSDKNRYISQLIADFPNEEMGIINFFSLVEETAGSTRMIVAPRLFKGFKSLLLSLVSYIKTRKTRDKTLSEVINSCISDRKLKIILSLHCGKILTPPDKLSFQAFSIVKNSYLNGGSYPAGSGDTIVNNLINELKRNGGSIECRSHVDEILIRRNRVTGVKLKSGEIIDADVVVSNAGILETYERMIKNYHSRQRYIMTKSRFNSSLSYLTLYIGLKGDISEFNISNTNYRLLSDTPFDFCNDPTSKDYSPNYFTIVFPSLRDLLHRDHEYQTAEIFIPTTYSFFRKWSKGSIGRRGEEYSELKARLTNMMLEKFDKQFPGILSHVEYTSLSTPLTNEDYILRNVGATYGLECIPEKMTSNLLHPKSDIKGLYFTGADIFIHGILGTCLCGLITASSVADKNLLTMYT